MPKQKVFETHSLFEAARQILEKSCEVEYWAKPERPPREEVLRRVKDKEGLVCLLTEKINEELLVAVARRLSEGEALARSGNWKNWNLDQLVGTDVWGKTLGIVGFGRIGRAVARRA